MTGPTTWTEARVIRLEKLWTEGRSASEIALALGGGVTRNAVIGKAYRIGLSRTRPLRPVAISAQKPRGEGAARGGRSREGRRLTGTVSPLGNEALKDQPPAHAVSLDGIRRDGCRWPFGDPLSDAFRLCGALAVRGAYCATHAARAYRPVPPRDHLLRLSGL